MVTTFPATEWKGQETSGKHSQPGQQAAFPLLGAVRAAALAPAEFINACSDVGALRLAAQQSGRDDFEVADELHIRHGYMSKVLHGTAGLYGRRLVNFMQITGSLAPLQWLAHQMGCDVVQRDSRAAEVAALRARLKDLERAA